MKIDDLTVGDVIKVDGLFLNLTPEPVTLTVDSVTVGAIRKAKLSAAYFGIPIGVAVLTERPDEPSDAFSWGSK